MDESKSRLMGFRVVGILFILIATYIVFQTLTSEKKKSFWSQFRNQPKFNLLEQPGNWRDQYGKKVSLKDIKKKVTILSFVYAECRTACPRIMGDMIRLKNSITASKTDANYLLFLFDINASQKTIDSFYKNYSIDKKQWTVLTGDRKSLNQLAEKFRIKYSVSKMDSKNERDYMHTNFLAITKSSGDTLIVDYGLNFSHEKLVKAIKLNIDEK